MKEVIRKDELLSAMKNGELVLPSKDLSNDLNMEIIRYDIKLLNELILSLMEER